MRVIWILDNKYRELYGLYDLKKKLKERNIDFILINKLFINPAMALSSNFS